MYGMIFNFRYDVIFVRHAESVGNAMSRDERAALEMPNHRYPLTPRGREQARITGRHLKNFLDEKGRGYAVLIAYQSTFLRTQETMGLILKELDRGLSDPITDPRLDEKWDGIFHELSRNELEERYPEQVRLRRRTGYYHYRAPGGESCPDVELRVRSFASELILPHDMRSPKDRDKPADACILIVCHGRWFQIFQRYFHGMSVEDFLKRRDDSTNDNCSVTVYRHYGPGGGYWGIPESVTPWRGLLEETGTDFA